MSQAVEKRQSSTRSVALLRLLHVGFVLTGMVNTVLGPTLPVLSARWMLDDAHVGNLFTAQFCGSMLGVVASSVLMARRGYRLPLLLGLALMALGSEMLLAANWISCIALALCCGIGLGLAIPTTNLLVSELIPEKRAAALNLINFSWGLGAVTCPFLVAALLRTHRIPLLFYALVTFFALVMVGLSMVSFPSFSAVKKPAAADPRVWRSHWLLFLGAMFFLYVGSEAAVGGWTATYAHRTAAGTGTLWVLMPACFWSTLLLGRALAPVLLKHMHELKVAQVGLVLSTLGLAVLLGTRNLPLIAIGVALAGLGFSSVYPIAIATLTHKFGSAASRVSGVTFTLAGAGGATLPWLVGYTSSKAASLKAGLLVPLFGCVVMFVLNVQLSRRDN